MIIWVWLMAYKKHADRCFFSFFLLALLFVFAVAYVKYGMLRTEAGVCGKAGVVLDESELRNRAFVNFMYKYTTLFFDKAGEFGEGGQRVGIIKNIKPDTFKDIIIKAADGAGSIEQRFSITRIEYGETKQSYERFLEELKSLKGSFAFVVYTEDVSPAGGVIYFSDEFSRVGLEEVNKTFYSTSAYEKFRGFENHYFRAGYRSFFLGCCGGKKTNDKYDGLAASLREVDRSSRESVQNYSVVAVSNCGAVLDEATESHRGYRQIKWIRGT